MTDNTRIEELETRLAFQDKSLQELGDSVYRQELQIERLEAAVRVLTERIADLAEAMPESAPDDQKPPHY
ncbi:MAG: SlyX family protein [Gammaproteobacteria bacterium]|jgi:SlyX protein